jgi:hypothetical protein
MSAVQYLTLGSISVGGTGSWEINYNLVMYYVVCILIGANVIAYFWNRGQVVAAAVSGLLLFFVFLFFGLRWFKGKPAAKPVACPKANGEAAASTAKCDDPCTCPPSVNDCPDFMVAYKASDGKVMCYDINNTYNLKSATGVQNMTSFTVGGNDNNQSGFESSFIKSNVETVAEAAKTSGGTTKYLTFEGLYPKPAA